MTDDPYRYFRVEAREILADLGQGVLRLERGTAGVDVAPRLFRLAHTLKGAARVVKQPAIAEHAHAIEEVLSPLRAPGGSLEQAGIDDVIRRLDAVGALVAALDAPAPEAAAREAPRVDASEGELGAAAAAFDEATRTLRVDVDELDALVRDLAEASVQVRALRDAAGPIAHASHLAEQLERDLAQAGDAAERLRLSPARALFGPLDRAARDVARALDRAVAFEMTGSDARLDAHVIGVVTPALAQAVRNAVAHGIESPAARRRAGKPETGRVTLSVSRRGSRVAFVCADDGAGIDVDAVRAVARRRGAVSDDPRAPAPSEREILQLLLRGGLSTSASVTEVAGRGIGLDIVRAVADRLGGEVTLRTERGRGASVELVVPMARAAIQALLVDTGGVVTAVPLEAVAATARVGEGEVHPGADGPSILHDGRLIPFLPLARALGHAERRAGGATSAVVLASGATRAAVGVDRLVGTANVVVRSLPPLATASAVVGGAMIAADGTPHLVLDPDVLVRLVAETRADAPAIAAAAPPPILVVDDSLTTRMLEKSILESAGYEVHLASSGEEGLEEARAHRHGLFLVDVEMPGIDGFTFVERTRADPALARTPAILVTSRNAPDDRRRGAEAGAAAYVVKSEFDQVELLRVIARLMEEGA